jgi:hypothetical protein
LSFIKSRHRRLEEHIGGGRCQECGLPPHGPGRIVLFGEAAPRQTLPDNPEERCSSCGGPLWCVLRVVYENAEGSDAA